MLERIPHHDVFARSCCYSPRTGFSEEFLIQSFSYTPDANFSEESLTLLMLVLVNSFSFNPDASFSEESLLHPSS